MADLYCEKNDFDQAFEFSTKKLRIQQAHLCPDHPLIDANLGIIRHQKSQYYRALSFYKRTQNLFEGVFSIKPKCFCLCL